MKKNLLLMMVALVIIPHVTFASWWNPFSWGIFSSIFHSKQQTHLVVTNTKPQEASKVTLATATSTPNSTSSALMIDSDMILCNGQYYKKCETGQLLVCPADSKVEAYCSIPKTPKLKQNEDAQDQHAPSVVIKSLKTNSVSPDKSQINTTVPNYKPQIINILNEAKKDYVAILGYSNECVALLNKRKTDLQTLDLNRQQVLRSVAGDDYLTKIYTAYFALIDAERNSIDSYMSTCSISLPDYLNSSIARINNAMLSVQNSNQPASIDDLVSYQLEYFGSDNIDKLRQGIKMRIDKISEQVATSNVSYEQALSSMDNYVSGVLKSTEQPSQYYIPPAPVVPQLPRITRCTISGDGGVGLQAYVDCTSY